MPTIEDVQQVATRLADDLDGARVATREWTDSVEGESLVAEAMDRALTVLASDGAWGKEHAPLTHELWQLAGSWLERGWLQHRAFSKPRGYAGDDELLARIWDDVRSEDPLGRHFDAYFQATDAAVAVRGRVRLAADAIVRHGRAKYERSDARDGYHIVSIGAGPAVEVALASVELAEIGIPPRVTLLDLDDDALSRAKARIATACPDAEVLAVRENVFRLARVEAKGQAAVGADFIGCLGLFDYLLPAAATALLRQLFNSLRAGGELLVGNFSTSCRARAYMECVGNWYLLHRTPDDLRELARRAGIPGDQAEIGAEPTGVNLLLRAIRPDE